MTASPPHAERPDTAPRTLYRKLVDSHTVATLDAQNVLLFCDLHLMNEYTSPQAFTGLHEQGRGVAMPGQNVAVVSHIIPTHPVAPQLRVIADPPSALRPPTSRPTATGIASACSTPPTRCRASSTSSRPSTG